MIHFRTHLKKKDGIFAKMGETERAADCNKEAPLEIGEKVRAGCSNNRVEVE